MTEQFKIILECDGVCSTSMGISFKLLCPGDVPAKAHKIIVNETTSIYEHICLEKHYVDVIFDLWNFDYRGYPLIDYNTNELIKYSVEPIWGLYDVMPWPWEMMLRKLL